MSSAEQTWFTDIVRVCHSSLCLVHSRFFSFDWSSISDKATSLFPSSLMHCLMSNRPLSFLSSDVPSSRLPNSGDSSLLVHKVCKNSWDQQLGPYSTLLLYRMYSSFDATNILFYLEHVGRVNAGTTCCRNLLPLLVNSTNFLTLVLLDCPAPSYCFSKLIGQCNFPSLKLFHGQLAPPFVWLLAYALTYN